MIAIILIGSVFCSFITAYLLVYRRIPNLLYNDWMLAILFICFSFCVIPYLFIITGWIINVPYLYRLFAPINYIIPPLCYLYVRTVLRNENKFKKTDILHLIPALLILINYIPFYMLPLELKKNLVNLLVSNYQLNYLSKNGFLPETIQITRPIQCLIYLILQWGLIKKFERQNLKNKFSKHTYSVLRWLKMFNLNVTITFGSFFIFVIFSILGITNQALMDQFAASATLLMALSILFSSSYLLLNPELLFGLPYIRYQQLDEKAHPKEKILNYNVFKTDYESEVKVIKEYFEQNKPYLNQGLRIRDVSVTLNMPMYELSFILNHYFNQSFTNYVNNYRIQFVVDAIKNQGLRNYTQEAIATSAGFSSKNGFYSAFRKVHDCTPLEYKEKQMVNG